MDVRNKGTRYPPDEFAASRGSASTARSTIAAKVAHYAAASPTPAAKLERRGLTLVAGYTASPAAPVDAPGRARAPRVNYRELVRDASPLLADLDDEKIVAYGIYSTEDSNDNDRLACMCELAHALYHDTYIRFRHELDAAAASNSPDGVSRAKPWVEVGMMGVLQPWHVADALQQTTPSEGAEPLELSLDDCRWILAHFRGTGDASVDWSKFLYTIAEACDREFTL